MGIHLDAGYLKIGSWAFDDVARLLHEAVALCWVPNPSNYSMIDHIDTNVHNCLPSNLRWVKGQAENQRNELTRKNMCINIKVKQMSVADGSLIKIWENASTAAASMGIMPIGILRTCRGRQ